MNLRPSFGKNELGARRKEEMNGGVGRWEVETELLIAPLIY